MWTLVLCKSGYREDVIVVVLQVMGQPDYGTIQEIIVKVYMKCNLGCTYCYVFEKADQSHLRLPRVMTIATARQVAECVSEHVLRLALPRVRLVVHGGEPLMAGIPLIRVLVGETRRLIAEKTGGRSQLYVSMQTNGVLLTNRRILDALHELGIHVGVSIDGDKDTHDQKRRTLPTLSHPEGLPTFERVHSGIELMRNLYPGMFSGLLCYVDVASDPAAVHDALVALRPGVIDYLWPLGHWNDLPPGLDPSGATTPYADWLIKLWKYHLALPDEPEPPRIRYFDMLITQLMSGWNPMELIGLPVRGALVIDTAGNYNLGDALSVVADGMMELRWRATRLEYKTARLKQGTRMGVFNCSIHDAAITGMQSNTHLGIKRMAHDGPLLCPTCMDCEWRMDCGGGHYPTRWKQGSGFWNPSVYCADLKKLLSFASGLYARLRVMEAYHRERTETCAAFSDVLHQRAAQLQ